MMAKQEWPFNCTREQMDALTAMAAQLEDFMGEVEETINAAGISPDGIHDWEAYTSGVYGLQSLLRYWGDYSGYWGDYSGATGEVGQTKVGPGRVPGPEDTAMAKTQYVAVTTTGESGWFVVSVGMPGESKASVTEEAAQKICGYQWNKAKDIVTDTQLKNLFVCSRTEARSRFPRAYRHFLEDVEGDDK